MLVFFVVNDSFIGEIFLKRPLAKGSPMHHLTISAVDGGDLTSSVSAHVWISAIDPNQQPPIFDQSRYSFAVSEGTNEGTIVGAVRATSAAGPGNISFVGPRFLWQL